MSDLNKLKIFTGVVFGAMIGGVFLLAKSMIQKETGEFNIGLGFAIVGTMIVSAFISYLLSIRKKKRNGNVNVPEIDERTILVLKNYFMWAFYFVIIGSGIISLVLYFMDVKTIELGMIFVYQTVLFMVVSIGAVIAKKIG